MKEKKLTVFLGGTCGDSKWRDKLLPNLDKNIEAFNPVVPNWTPECQAVEDAHKANDDINLFCITPATNSPYSLYEIGEASHDKARTVVCFLNSDLGAEFEGQQAKAVAKIKKDLEKRGIPCFESLSQLAEHLNQRAWAKNGITPSSFGE